MSKNELKNKMVYEDYIELLRLLENGKCSDPDKISDIVCKLHDIPAFREFATDDFLTRVVYNEFGANPPYAVLANATILLTHVVTKVLGPKWSGHTIFPDSYGFGTYGVPVTAPIHSRMYQLIIELTQMEKLTRDA